MENLTPAELLRFLEEEASTLRLMNGKIATQIHCLQVEEELFSRQLTRLEKPKSSASAIEFVQSEQNGNGKLDTEDYSQVQSTVRVGSPEQALGSSPMLLQSLGTQYCSAGDVDPTLLQSPGTQNWSAGDVDPTLLQSPGTQNCSAGDVDPTLLQSPGTQNWSAGGVDPTFLQSPGTHNRSAGDVEEPKESVEIGNDHEVELQGQPQDQEALQVRETALLDRVQEPNEAVEVENDHEVELKSQQQELESLQVRETPLVDRVQEPESVEAGNDHEVNLQGRRQGTRQGRRQGGRQGGRQEQEALQVQDTPQRASGRRISRRPARVLD